ncbi:MAG: PKD domain-containing protein [Bacteroidetes bacterium]|nr:PKD domain-containing protein [Bacteroidota bacterium]
MKQKNSTSQKIIVLFFTGLPGLFVSQSLAQQNIEPSLSAKFMSQDGKQQSIQSIRGNGLCFTPNKGQIVDMAGNLCPDLLYKGDGGGADMYLRKTGISYVYNNMGTVQHKVNEQVEELIQAGTITEADEHKRKVELLQRESIKIHRVDMDFANCNENIKRLSEDEVGGYNNYYYAHCPQGVTNVKQFNKVTYKNIYNGIDVKYYGGKEQGIKYDIIVQPHADPHQIKLIWKGAESIHLKREGSLEIKTSVNEFYESLPKVYQVIDGKVVDVKTKYVLTTISKNETIINFSFANYNSSFPLVIDPWATYFPAQCFTVATDKTGNVLIAGSIVSPAFPFTTGAFQTTFAGIEDAFVAKLNPLGTTLLWATFYGGSLKDRGEDIAADNLSNVVISGMTFSNDLPITPGAFQTNFGGVSDAFVIKFNSFGTRLWATYYGGSDSENDGWSSSTAIATDNSDNVLIKGVTISTDLPITPGAFQTTFGGGGFPPMYIGDAFVVKFNSLGTRQWATYYGGSASDGWYCCGDIATDNSGNVVITGETSSANFPKLINPGGYNQAQTGQSDAFVVKFDPFGTRLWATIIGGNGRENSYASAIAIDNIGNVIITGSTQGGFPVTAGAVQLSYGGGNDCGDVFVAKFDPTGIRLWATYYGLSTNEQSYGVVTDTNNNIYVYMEPEDVATPNLVDACSYQPVFNEGFVPAIGSPEDQLIVKFTPTGKKLCATYMGGKGEDDLDGGGGIAIYGNSLYITGGALGYYVNVNGTWVRNGGYPITAGAFQTTYTYNIAGSDAFIASLCSEICEGKLLGLDFTAESNSVCANSLVTFTPTITNSCDTTSYKYKWTFTGATPSSSIDPKPSITYSTPGSYPVKLIVTTPCKTDSVIKLSYITVNNCGCVMSASTSVTANASCSGVGNGSANINISNGSGGSYKYNWSNGVSGSTTASTIPINSLSTNTYSVTVTDGSCASVTTVTILPQNTLSINSISATSVSCDNGNDGKATIIASSNSGGPYTYSWSTGVSTITTSISNELNNLSLGTYTVNITQGSCTVTSTVTITQPGALAVLWGSSLPSCLTDKATVSAIATNGTSPYAYVWSSGQTTPFATGLSLNVTYTVTVTDANGCIATNTFTPTIMPMLITPISTNISCTTSGSASVIVRGGSPPFVYNWSNGQTGSSITSNVTAGNYTVTVTGAGGCTTSQTINITGTSPASATFTQSPNNTICVGTTVNFTNTGTTGTYNWFIQNLFVFASTVDFSYTFLTPGVFNFTHKVTTSGCTATETGSVTVINCNAPTVTATGSSICPGSCATVTSIGNGGTSPYIYLWSNGATTQNINPCPASTTTYTVTIKDAGGNTSTSIATVTINPPVSVIITPTNISCSGGTNGSILANPASGTIPYIYNWSNGQNTQTATGLTTGIYTVTVTDAKSCTSASTANIFSPPPLFAQFTKGSATCISCGCKEWIMVNATGGTNPYTYFWPDGYTNRYKNQLCPGNYTINITDKNGCIVNVNITAP